MTGKDNVSPGFSICYKCGAQFKRYSTKSTHRTCPNCMKSRRTTQSRSPSELRWERERKRRKMERLEKQNRKEKKARWYDAHNRWQLIGNSNIRILNHKGSMQRFYANKKKQEEE